MGALLPDLGGGRAPPPRSGAPASAFAPERRHDRALLRSEHGPHPDEPHGRADLHIHSLASDGVCGVEEILDWVVEHSRTRRHYVQEPLVNPATQSYEFGGVLVYETTGSYAYYRGDTVEIGGSCSEYFGMTEMIPNNPEAVYLTRVRPGPARAASVHTRVLADDVTHLGEAWEAVWVKTDPVAVLDTLGSATSRSRPPARRSTASRSTPPSP